MRRRGRPRATARKDGRSAAQGAGLEERLGYRFDDPALLRRALTHRSCVHEGQGGEEDYERLEFLGDALLGFLVSERLFADDSAADEGVLTRRRQSVVRMDSLAEISRGLRLGDDLRLGRGEDGSGGRARPGLLADVFEGVLAAVYLDGGIRAARSFVRRHLRTALERARGSEAAQEDYKTRLQEEVQAAVHATPQYRLTAVTGPAHAREFEAEVLLAGEVIGRGTGTSRKTAEQEAARRALDHLHGRRSEP